ATVFLNGELLFTGNCSYQSRSASYLGAISLEDALHLHLKPGRNEVLFQITESFGGWGLVGQDNDADYQHESLTKLWELDTVFQMPESAIYDPQRDVFYVSNFYRGGNEFISRVDRNGTVLDLEWVTGLSRPTGMVIHDDRLWIIDRAHLNEIDLEVGEIVNQFEVPEPGFINDVAFHASGDAYISDSNGSKLYRFRGGEVAVWLEGEEVSDPNGLLMDNDRLVFGNSGDGCLKAVNLTTRQVTTITCCGAGAIMDGLRSDGRGNYLFSDFNGRLIRVSPEGEQLEVLNTTSSGAYCADFEYVRDRQMIVVPGLYNNRLTAYGVDGL
ncbi:MAG: SMP-30/gluconolactonase/LRE family protein, partial [bacterium]